MCDVCLSEKLAIMENKERNSLIQRTELLKPIHSPVTQDNFVSKGEIAPAESRGSGDGSSSKAGNKTEAREPQLKVETSLTTREDGETAVAGGEI